MSDITAARPVDGASVATGWGAQVHDLVEGVQAGSVSVPNFNNSTVGTAAVVFPHPYVTPPNVVAGISSNVCQPAYNNVTTTGFNVTARRTDGNATNTTQTVWWLAVGTAA